MENEKFALTDKEKREKRKEKKRERAWREFLGYIYLELR